jgi:hypothetical protein
VRTPAGICRSLINLSNHLTADAAKWWERRETDL